MFWTSIIHICVCVFTCITDLPLPCYLMTGNTAIRCCWRNSHISSNRVSCSAKYVWHDGVFFQMPLTIQVILILVCGEAIASHLQSVLHKLQTSGAHRYVAVINSVAWIHVGFPESFRTFKIARHCIDLAGRGKCYSLVMSLANWVAKTALPSLG